MNAEDVVKEYIKTRGIILGKDFLKVDSFMNHRIEPQFIEAASKAISERFKNSGVTLVLTAESAGNIIAYEVAKRLMCVALYAKKNGAVTMSNPLKKKLYSPTRKKEVELAISKDYLNPDDKVLIVDDFLYNGRTSSVLAEMVLEVGASLVGFGFIVEKAFAGGRENLKRFKAPIYSIAVIERMDPETGISFK